VIYPFKFADWKFELELAFGCPFPAALKKDLPAAIKATLKVIPKSVLKKKLHHHSFYRIAVSLVGESDIHQLNLMYRHKDRPTDVLSFSQLEGPVMPSPHGHVGEVIVCWKICQAQAREQGVTQLEELQRLVVHGTLHLFGYDHETNEKDAKKMFGLQEKALQASRKVPTSF